MKILPCKVKILCVRGSSKDVEVRANISRNHFSSVFGYFERESVTDGNDVVIEHHLEGGENVVVIIFSSFLLSLCIHAINDRVYLKKNIKEDRTCSKVHINTMQSLLMQFTGLLLLSCGSLTNGHLRRFRKVVFFGDSFTDTGNTYRVTDQTWPIVPPYYQGRFTNGPNWVDQLDLLDKENYAYGGATTDSQFVQGYTKLDTVKAPGVRQQIVEYLENHAEKTIPFSQTLHIVWAGGNDFVFNNSIPPQMIANSLINCLRDLIAAGAKHLLMFNQPPVQYFPYLNQLGQSALFTQLTKVANDATIAGLTILKQNNTDVSINLFDVHAVVTKIVTNNSMIHFTNTVDRCWTEFNITALGQMCSNPSEYAFIDQFHLTSEANGLIAAALRPFLTCGSEISTLPNSLIRSF